MCHTWKLKKVNILPFSGLIYPLMGRKIKIPASCVFSYSFEEHSCAMRTLYYQNCRRSSRKYEITYLPRKGVMGLKNEKSGFLRFLVWVRKAHSSNYNNLLLKLKEEFEKMFQVRNCAIYPFQGVKRGEIENQTLPMNSGWKNRSIWCVTLENWTKLTIYPFRV